MSAITNFKTTFDATRFIQLLAKPLTLILVLADLMILRPEIAPFWNAAVASFVWQDSGHTNSVGFGSAAGTFALLLAQAGRDFKMRTFAAKSAVLYVRQ